MTILRRFLNCYNKNIFILSLGNNKQILQNVSQKAVYQNSLLLKSYSTSKINVDASKNIFFKRNFMTTTLKNSAYEGDGKTTVSDMKESIGKYVVIDKYNDEGFILSNGAYSFGPLILFPTIFLSWKIETIDDINEESLTIFKIIEPKLDLLVLGIGSIEHYSLSNIRELKQRISNTGINVEILSTSNAITTYNFMLADFRVVAGAFIPQSTKIVKTFFELESSQKEKNETSQIKDV